MDFSKALVFPFKDDNWIVKFGVGGLAMVVGIFIPVIPLGYQVRVARNVMRHEREVLPGPNDLMQVLVDGTMAFLASLLYALPLTPFLCVVASSFGLVGNSGIGSLLALCVSLCVLGFVVMLGLPLGALFAVGVMRYAETGNFASFLEVRALWEDVRANLGTMVLLLAYGLVFGALTVILSPFLAVTCLGVPLGLFYAQVVTGHMLGQAGRLVVKGEL